MRKTFLSAGRIPRGANYWKLKNRDAKVSLIVFDISLVDNSILKAFDNVGYIPGIGFIAIINSQKGDYSNLAQPICWRGTSH